MTQSERTAYDAREARSSRLFAKYYGRMRLLIMRDGEKAARYYEAGADAQLAAALLDSKATKQLLGALLLECATLEASETYAALQQLLPTVKKAKPTPVSSVERINNFIATEGGKDIRNITETTRKQIRQVLQQAQQQGLGRQEAASLLRDRVAGLAAKRATTIVRTELLTAANYGSLEGAKALRVPLRKKWLATPGSRTRIDHQLANGEFAELEGVFEDIGGERAHYPGDPNLSAGQRVNCRCSIGYEPLK